MTAKEKLVELRERLRDGELMTDPEYYHQIRAIAHIAVIEIRIRQEDDAIITAHEFSVANKAQNMVERWEMNHKETGEQLPEGTYGSVFEDSDGNSVDSEWTGDAPPPVGEA